MTRKSMTCRQTIGRLIDYVDDRMRRSDHDALERHLDQCPRCIEFLESYRRTPEIIRRLTQVPVPARVGHRLHQLLDEVQAHHQRRPPHSRRDRA